MCGIAGIYNLDASEVKQDLLKRMADSLIHRGPDDEGFYINRQRNFGLAHRRLSIIDLHTGRQPISNEDESIWIAANGEIYNFLELRQDLIAKKHNFYTKSDTEVIVHLYEEYGQDCLKHLRGMFAFAIWDENNKRLFLARDRVGKKPLVYYSNGRTFAFASEIKAILQIPGLSRAVDINALDDYLTYGYSPSPRTMFEGICKVPPASYLLFDKNGMRISRYWHLDYGRKVSLDEKECRQKLMDLLDESVRLRLISDVPLGAFLSGGIDSSAVVALMSRNSTKPVKTFSIGFEESDYSELAYARIVAKRFSTDHHEFVVKPEAMEILPKLIWHYNEPFGDSSCIPSFYVAKVAKQFVTVALNGDGGDESFAGYQRYIGAKLSQKLNFVPSCAAAALAGLFKMIGFNAGRSNLISKAGNVFEALYKEPNFIRRYARWTCYFTDEQKHSIYSARIKERLSGRDSLKMLEDVIFSSSASNIVEKLINADVYTYLPEDLLVKMDIATMAHAVEGRSPFLDHNVMEFAASLPLNLKLKGLRTKYILKDAMKELLPKEILSRGKMGFGVPIGNWFRNEMKDYVYRMLLSDKAARRPYFNQCAVKALLDEHCSAKADRRHRIWALLNFELWHRMFIDGEKF